MEVNKKYKSLKEWAEAIKDEKCDHAYRYDNWCPQCGRMLEDKPLILSKADTEILRVYSPKIISKGQAKIYIAAEGASAIRAVFLTEHPDIDIHNQEEVERVARPIRLEDSI